MKRLISILFVMCLITIGCRAEGKKSIVVYFSATGTTAKVAQMLAKEAKADIYAIAPKQVYTENDLNWRNAQSRTTLEMRDKTSRPELRSKKDLSDYEIIYLGFPIWWGVAPHIVNTFIEQANMEGKTVVVFATSDYSKIDKAAAALKKDYPKINWKDSYLLNKATPETVKTVVIPQEEEANK